MRTIAESIDPRWSGLIHLLAHSGLRYAGATALRPVDVTTADDHSTLRISRAWKRTANDEQIGTPKSPRSRCHVTPHREVASRASSSCGSTTSAVNSWQVEWEESVAVAWCADRQFRHRAVGAPPRGRAFDGCNQGAAVAGVGQVGLANDDQDVHGAGGTGAVRVDRDVLQAPLPVGGAQAGVDQLCDEFGVVLRAARCRAAGYGTPQLGVEDPGGVAELVGADQRVVGRGGRPGRHGVQVCGRAPASDRVIDS
ncbi:hypothetical protein RCG67_06745 [Kocuria sp. CPCC 205292]|uniref:hypothetical protein n=1 Tax=Kocuria cellulosilytica TaxID=3071451 RepID=UPI0034D3A88D